MLLVNRAIVFWTICSLFLLLLTLKLNDIVLWNWFIVFIPMWMLDFVLLVSTFVSMGHRYIRLLGQCNPGTKLDQFLLLFFITSKLLSQIMICLYSEGYLIESGGFRPLRFLYVFIPCAVTLLISLAAVCSKIFNDRLRLVWSLCSDPEFHVGAKNRVT